MTGWLLRLSWRNFKRANELAVPRSEPIWITNRATSRATNRSERVNLARHQTPDLTQCVLTPELRTTNQPPPAGAGTHTVDQLPQAIAGDAARGLGKFPMRLHWRRDPDSKFAQKQLVELRRRNESMCLEETKAPQLQSVQGFGCSGAFRSSSFGARLVRARGSSLLDGGMNNAARAKTRQRFRIPRTSCRQDGLRRGFPHARALTMEASCVPARVSTFLMLPVQMNHVNFLTPSQRKFDCAIEPCGRGLPRP